MKCRGLLWRWSWMLYRRRCFTQVAPSPALSIGPEDWDSYCLLIAYCCDRFCTCNVLLVVWLSYAWPFRLLIVFCRERLCVCSVLATVFFWVIDIGLPVAIHHRSCIYKLEKEDTGSRLFVQWAYPCFIIKHDAVKMTYTNLMWGRSCRWSTQICIEKWSPV